MRPAHDANVPGWQNPSPTGHGSLLVHFLAIGWDALSFCRQKGRVYQQIDHIISSLGFIFAEFSSYARMDGTYRSIEDALKMLVSQATSALAILFAPPSSILEVRSEHLIFHSFFLAYLSSCRHVLLFMNSKQ